MKTKFVKYILIWFENACFTSGPEEGNTSLITGISRPVWSKNRYKGAVIVEYVLLLVACVAMATVIAEFVEFGSNPDESGALIKVWMGVLKTIAEDMD